MSPSRTKLLAVLIAPVLVATSAITVGAAVLGDANSPLVVSTTVSPAAGAASPSESVFVPITPCRIVDTRQAGGKLEAGDERAWVAAGTTQFVPQGGKSGGCGIPEAASAIVVSMTATNATGTNGFLRAYPDNVTTPNATFMNYTSAFNVTGSGTIPLDTAGVPDFKVRNFFQSTHVVIDVSGYYVAELMASVDSAGGLKLGNGVVSTQALAPGQYEVIFNRNVTGCAYTASLANTTDTGEIVVDPRFNAANGVFVQTHASGGATAAKAFYLIVDC